MWTTVRHCECVTVCTREDGGNDYVASWEISALVISAVSAKLSRVVVSIVSYSIHHLDLCSASNTYGGAAICSRPVCYP
ncbi:Uncharacterized protein HZ326_29759 [Fusarium oxysporum f. sp. albedinis]|nr:Uncharacterized protein HZ326_29759 [Fusarium oxysporum f. sp. albedinis]